MSIFFRQLFGDTLKKHIRIKEFWIHIIVWACLILFPLSISYIDLGEVRFGMFYRILLNPILVYINYLILVPYFLLKKEITLYIIISITVLVLFNFLIKFVPFPHVPIDKFTELIQNTEMHPPRKPPHFIKDMQPLKRLPYFMTAIISLTFFLLGGVLGLTKDFYKRDRKSREAEVQRKETELQFLRAQLNPHFLFNSLNSVYSLVRNKSIEAPEAIIMLSELMRYMLYEAKQELVPLSKEIDYIKNFVSLQLLRLSHSENVKIKISGDYQDKKIPPLLLIPFVENAFKYGTDFKGRTDVSINMELIEESLFFIVKNKIGVYRKDESNSGIGLENIKGRLYLLYPDQHVLKIDKTDGFYTVQLELNL